MNIYKMKRKELKEEIKKFHKSEYGKIVFLNAYTTPLFLVLLSIVTTIMMINWNCFYFLETALVVLLMAVLVTFLIGNAYFYKELRDFVNSDTKNRK